MLANTFAYLFLLFMDMPNLKPNVFLGQWTWWVIYDVLEALDYG